jgi:hypothetical protein
MSTHYQKSAFYLRKKIRRYSQGFSCGLYHYEQFPADYLVLGNSAGIPKDFSADFATHSIFLRIIQFQKIPQVFPRIFLRILAPHFPADLSTS